MPFFFGHNQNRNGTFAEQLPVEGGVEQGLAATLPDLAQGLVAHGLRQARRALRLRLLDLEWRFPGDAELELAFSLPRGGYASTVIDEIINVQY